MKKSALALIGVLAISSFGFLAFKSSDSNKAFYELEYQVNCEKCTVSYRNEKGASEIISNVDQWKHKFNAKKGHFVYISATNNNGDPVEVKILKDGLLEASDESKEEFVSARVGAIL